MPNPHDLLSLAERCEKAEAGSRELDAEIVVALKIGARGLLPDDHEYLSRVRKDDGCAPGTYWFHCRSGKSLRTAPFLTTSLDAAMSLVPEGYEWIRKWPRSMTVYRVPPDDKTWALHHDAAGATPALALCAANLRALAAMEAEKGGADHA